MIAHILNWRAHRLEMSVGWTRAMLALPAEEMSEAKSTARQKRIFEARRSGDVRTLIAALTDDENREWAARYLGEMADPDAIRPLIRLLSVNDFQARAAAAQALGQLHAVEAVPALLECVDRGPEDVMRAWAIDALGKIGSPEAVPRLIELLTSPEEGFRRTAATALGAIGDPRCQGRSNSDPLCAG